MLDVELRRETGEVVQLHDALLRRLGQAGIGSFAELVERFEQVRRASGAISTEEIDAALARIAGVVDQLRLARKRIGELSDVLQAFGVGNREPERGNGRDALD